MLKNLSIAQKLIGGFLIIAFITAVVGFAGWNAVSIMQSQVQNLGNQSIPSIVNMLEVQTELLKIKNSMRTLLSPYISQETYERELGHVSDSRDKYRALLKKYDAMKKTADEEKLYRNFQADLVNVVSADNQFFAMAKELHQAKNKDELGKKATDFATVSTSTQDDLKDRFDHLVDECGILKDYISKHYGEEEVASSEEFARYYNIVIILVSVIGVALALILGIFISRSISRPVNRVTEDLFNSSNSLESAAGQVSSSSQELSSGASELASSVEEMTSSLQELQSIIESTTKNVVEAELMTREAMDGSKENSSQMDEMLKAMNEISENSRKISKIIKVIDDIAFQTNILALNAAVEAARAGDAGRGFAVVAEQVKSLAQKSAEAAKETADLMENAISSVSSGNNIADKVKKVSEKAQGVLGKVGAMMDEVTRASKEQLNGANQVNKAVSQINTIVENTAASSEETASAGEELLSQAEMLKGVVNKLNVMVKGRKGGAAAAQAGKGKDGGAVKKPDHPYPKTTQENGIELIRPEDKIPMDDFKDF
ncbi:MAG: methyl-accepting chemotaxis protein [Brevinematales bacterium]|jgi:methyl-accepting chemotaxis protein